MLEFDRKKGKRAVKSSVELKGSKNSEHLFKYSKQSFRNLDKKFTVEDEQLSHAI
jgi:hypothetical protein